MSQKSPKKTVDLSTLVVQVTKPRGRVTRRLAEFGLRIVTIPEDEGNVERFVISKRVAVDRRTGNGFLNAIMDKTLFTSAIYLREHFRLPVLIVEGGINYEYRGFDPQAVRGALSSMVLEYGMSVLSTADVEDTAQLIAMIARQEQIGIPEISLIPKRKAVSLPDMQRRLIEMLPGCGRVMAKELLQRFGSVARIVRATEEELRSVRGVGVKKAREMCRVLAAEYEAVDTERQIEDAVERDPSLLFTQKVSLLARQHYIFDDEKGRHIVDLVFRDVSAREIVLVELKLGRLQPWHREQLRRYLDRAGESRLIRGYLDKGDALRGVLASLDPGDLKLKYKDITAKAIDGRSVIEILKDMRREDITGAD